MTTKRFLQLEKKYKGYWECFYCKKRLVKDVLQAAPIPTVDHVIPISKGGSVGRRGNLRVACFGCNQAKADRAEFKMKYQVMKTVASFWPKEI